MPTSTFYYSDGSPTTSTDTIITQSSYNRSLTLTSVDIDSGVTSIGNDAFLLCEFLLSIIIPNGVTSIGSFAFHECYSLTSITIPNSVTSIGTEAFSYCISLTRVNFLGNAPTLGSDVFGNTSAKIYRKKNFVTGWSFTFGGKPVVLISDNVVKSGGTGKLTTKRRSLFAYDPDATIYINNVEAADGQSLEDATKNAINAFVVGCKSDGIWDAIKSSCILAGARTLNGALIPLKGTAPTNNFFISSDYNRATGLQGNASNKYLNSNRACDADPVNSIHRAFYITSTSINNNTSIYGTVDTCAPADGEGLIWSSPQWYPRIRSNTASNQGNSSANGFIGLSSNNSSTFIFRKDSTQTTPLRGVLSPKNNNMYIYALNYRDNCAASFRALSYTNARLTFYSLGENLNLSLLNARINTLMSTISTLT